MKEIKHKETGEVLHTVNADTLAGAKLCRLNLSGAKLKDEDLSNANLQGAKLDDACLWDACLQDADLTGATGLLADQLAGADLTRAKLPDNLKDFESLKTAEEMSKNSGKYFIAMLAACAFALLTITGTPDAGLFTNTISSTLPILGTSIATVSFFWVTPFLLIGAYIYFHLDLQRLWDTLARLPAVFVDGKALDEKSYPWLLNGLTRIYVPRLRSTRRPMLRLQTWISVILAWWSVPITLILFWLRYLKRHEWSGTVMHMILIIISILYGIYAYRLAVGTFQAKGTALAPWSLPKRLLGGMLVLGLMSLLLIFSYGGIDGVRSYQTYTVDQILAIQSSDTSKSRPRKDSLILLQDTDGSYLPVDIQPHHSTLPPGQEALVIGDEDQKLSRFNPRLWVPILLQKLSFSPFAEMSGTDIVTRPSNWIGKEDKDFDLINPIDLRRAKLRYARASGAFLVKADLANANLTGAILDHADLRHAHLEFCPLQANLNHVLMDGAFMTGVGAKGAMLNFVQAKNAVLQRADLNQASLYGAVLTKAQLQYAQLNEAHLEHADLSDAHLDYANLQGAQLQWANLQRAELENANLDNALLASADLENADLDEAALYQANLYGAVLRGVDLQDSGLGRAELLNANLQGANLMGANLMGADLEWAKLQKSNLRGADLRGAGLKRALLKGADLRGADIRGASNLTQTQLDSAYTNLKTQVSPPLKVHPSKPPSDN